jgi:hypothetical protein
MFIYFSTHIFIFIYIMIIILFFIIIIFLKLNYKYFQYLTIDNNFIIDLHIYIIYIMINKFIK